MKALAKVGLVELDGSAAQPAAETEQGDMSEEDIQRILAETKNLGGDEKAEPAPAKPPTTPAPAAASPPPAPAEATGAVVEGTSFDDIYAESDVPASPFPAEKLLKLLDGLKAMDTATRKAAVVAMDAADDAWTIEDAILDANRKVQVLEGQKQQLQANLEASETKAKSELEAQDTYQREATQTIREQIAELEATLQAEVQAVAEAKADIKARVEADRSAAKREQARLDEEVKRLSEIGRIFKTEGS